MSLEAILNTNFDLEKHNIVGITLENIPKTKDNLAHIKNNYPTKILLFLDRTTPDPSPKPSPTRGRERENFLTNLGPIYKDYLVEKPSGFIYTKLSPIEEESERYWMEEASSSPPLDFSFGEKSIGSGQGQNLNLDKPEDFFDWSDTLNPLEKSQENIWVSIPRLNFLHLFLGIVHHPSIKSVMYRLYLDKDDDCSDFAECYEVNGELYTPKGGHAYWRFTKYPVLKYKYDMEVCVISNENVSRKFEVAWIHIKNFKFNNRYSAFNAAHNSIDLETFFDRPIYIC